MRQLTSYIGAPSRIDRVILADYRSSTVEADSILYVRAKISVRYRSIRRVSEAHLRDLDVVTCAVSAALKYCDVLCRDGACDVLESDIVDVERARVAIANYAFVVNALSE